MLIFAHDWIFWLAPLPLIVRWLVPPRALVRPAVRVPFLGRLRAAGGDASRQVAGWWLVPLLALFSFSSFRRVRNLEPMGAA
jgi:hypothetical protein